MPEIAEVETVRKQLDKILKGKKIKEAVVDTDDKFLFSFAPANSVQKALKGAKVTGTGRRGKYFWIELNKKPWPIFHLGMTGNISILSPKFKNKTHQKIWGGITLQSSSDNLEGGKLWFCRLLIKMADGTDVGFIDPRRLGRVWLSDDPLNHPRIKKLGPDPLIKFPSAKELYQKLNRRRIPIKTLLLDQKLFSGIGNWLADEILFQSKISPHRIASSLSEKDVATLRKNVLGVVNKAVKVNADYDLFPKNWLFHHRWGKSKTAKTSSGKKIIHDEIGGRTAAWVPGYQK